MEVEHPDGKGENGMLDPMLGGMRWKSGNILESGGVGKVEQDCQ